MWYCLQCYTFIKPIGLIKPQFCYKCFSLHIMEIFPEFYSFVKVPSKYYETVEKEIYTDSNTVQKCTMLLTLSRNLQTFQ